MRPMRLLASVVALGLAIAAGFHLSQRPPVLPPQPMVPRSPPMDISSANERLALAYLRDSDPGRFNGSWLGDECWRADLGERYVWSSSDFSRGVVERAQFTITGDEGFFYFDVQPDRRPLVVRYGPRWKLNNTAVSQFREILVQGEYFGRGSSDLTSGVCDADMVTLESCIDGRYYGVVRKCESLYGDDGRPLSRLNAMLQAFMGVQTGGASTHLVAESEAETRRRNGASRPGL